MGRLFLPAGRFFVLGASASPVSGGADTNENILATVTVPAGAMGLNGILRVRSQWTTTNSGNNKTLKVRLGGIGGTAFLNFAVTTAATYEDARVIQNRNSQSSQVSRPSANSLSATSSLAVTTGTIDTSAAQDLVFTGQKASSGETLTLESYLVELIVPQ